MPRGRPRQKRNSSATVRQVERAPAVPTRSRRSGPSGDARGAGADALVNVPEDDAPEHHFAPVNDEPDDAPVHAPFKAPGTMKVLFEDGDDDDDDDGDDDDDDDDDDAAPPPGSPRCVVCSTTQDVVIVERAQDLLRSQFYAWCCSTCARKYVKPRPDPRELNFATDDDEPLSPLKRQRLSFGDAPRTVTPEPAPL